MSKLKRLKEEYDRIPIPEELGERIGRELGKAAKRREEERRRAFRRKIKAGFRMTAGAAAAALLVFTAALNTSTAFAGEAARLPVIGGLARVLTFRSYETEEDGIGISVEIPAIEAIEQETGLKMEKVNRQIYDMCAQYAQEAAARAEEYRRAFLDTGGSEEEWEEHKIKIQVGYEIKSQSGEYLSFVVRGTESWTTAYSQARYYNVDLKTGNMVTLKDLLGEDAAAKANESIRRQIEERSRRGEIFFTEEEGGFSGISEDTGFYINESGRPVIVFEKYGIAPGSAGEVEFEIGG